ncbi:MAG: hypothetical protein ACYSUK_08515 [Planctomycetota bacterium]|jgi:hypothetical protein
MRIATYLLLLIFCIACFAGQENTTPVKKVKSNDAPAPKVKKSESTFTAAPKKEGTPKVSSKSNQKQTLPKSKSFSSVTVETPFGEATDILRNSTKPPLKIVVMWRDLRDNAGVYRDTPVGIDGISGIKAGTALDFMLQSISAQSLSKVDYVVKEGIIIIGTDATIGKKKMVTRVYNVSYLTSPAVGYGPVYPSFGMGGFGGMGGMGGGGFGQGGFGNLNGGGMSGMNNMSR